MLDGTAGRSFVTGKRLLGPVDDAPAEEGEEGYKSLAQCQPGTKMQAQATYGIVNPHPLRLNSCFLMSR